GTPWEMGARGPERMSGSPRGVSISPAWEVASDRSGNASAVGRHARNPCPRAGVRPRDHARPAPERRRVPARSNAQHPRKQTLGGARRRGLVAHRRRSRCAGGRVVNVGDRRGALTIISVDRSRGVVELVCPDGHSDTRPYESVRVSASPRCRWCVPPATPLQLETLRIIRRHEQETAEGMTRVQILEAIRRDSPYVLHSLRAKGWVEKEGRAWFLTDDGIDVLEGRRAARVVPPKSTPPAVAQATI